MDFDYTDDQRSLRDEARRFLAAQQPVAAARRVLDDPGAGHDAALWQAVAAQGWLGVTIPEAYGGLGMTHVDLGAIAEEIGASLAPIPFGSTLYLYAEAVMLAGSPEQRERLLPAAAAGEIIGCGAIFEGAGDVDVARLTATVSNRRLSGVKTPVVDGGIADAAIIVASDEDGPGLFVARLERDTVRAVPLEAVDGSSGVARLEFSNAPVERLGASDAATITTLLARAAVLGAFEQVGAADRCLALATAYVSERHAFGGPVGRFQAVKHTLADVFVTNQLARSHAYHGAWAIDHAQDRLLGAAAAARISASDAYWQAAKEGLHLHGAIGFTWEHDAHLYYRRAHHLSLALGSPTWWADRLYEVIAA